MLLPKLRNKVNRPLPRRWRLKHGAYFYRVPSGTEHLWGGKKEFRLGATLLEASVAWAKRVEPSKMSTIGDLLDRYALEVVPKKAAATTSAPISLNSRRMSIGPFERSPRGVIARRPASAWAAS